ncbi:MAG: hypothetical protein KDA87_03280 [Planctomycetales bacterium]|nr:hypothetical protein [Planctomycetales bacterium]
MRDIFVATCLLSLANAGLFAQANSIPLTGQTGDDIVTLVYDPAGQWWFEHPVNEAALLEMFELGFGLTREEQWERLQSLEEPNDTNTRLATTLEVVSADEFFAQPWQIFCSTIFCDPFTLRHKVFHLDPSGFGSLVASGAVPGLDGELVSQMLTVSGSFLGGGALEPVDLRVIQYGDVTKDGLLDEFDIDAVSEAIRRDWSELPVVYDLNQDGTLDGEDRRFWVREVKQTYFGDANLDGEFNSSDLVAVFKAGEFEDAIANNSTWSEGDWNGDGEFDSSDFVWLFEIGYELGPRPPHSLRGDFDHDGRLDLDDINLLLRHVNIESGESSDVNDDGLVNNADIEFWVTNLKNTWIGDANLDGEFDSSDLVLVFQAGKYGQDVEALWHEGDWTGDLRFDASDFVAAFSGHGELPPRPLIPVPEPSFGIMLSLVGLCLSARRQFHALSVDNHHRPKAVGVRK